MSEELKKIMIIGLGLFEVTKEKLEILTKVVMEKGKMKEPEARAFVKKISSEAEKKRVAIENTIMKELNKMAKKVEKATRVKAKLPAKKKA